MRFVRLLAVVILLYGLSYLQYGLLQLYSAIRSGGAVETDWYIIATNFNIGLVTFIIGVGLLIAKEWARKLWLLCSIVLLAIHLFLLFMFYVNGLRGTQQILNVILISILLLISWTKLTRRNVKQLFK
jgi:hypothetical protein